MLIFTLGVEQPARYLCDSDSLGASGDHLIRKLHPILWSFHPEKGGSRFCQSLKADRLHSHECMALFGFFTNHLLCSGCCGAWIGLRDASQPFFLRRGLSSARLRVSRIVCTDYFSLERPG